MPGHATDLSIYRQPPIGVVIPRTVEELSLFPDHAGARRLSQQTVLFDEYLRRIGYRPPKLQRRAIVHGDCHRKALMGCCGMAGSFGYERAHYDVSVKVGEHALLPRVRGEAADTLIVAEGFSCREQIAQTTDRQAMHLSEVLAMGLPRPAEVPKAPPFPWKRVAAAAAVTIAAAMLFCQR